MKLKSSRSRHSWGDKAFERLIYKPANLAPGSLLGYCGTGETKANFKAEERRSERGKGRVMCSNVSQRVMFSNAKIVGRLHLGALSQISS